MRRTLTLFATLLILWMLVAQLNHLLSTFRVYLFAGSLFVTFAALMQPFGAGLFAVMLAGLVCDAHAPVAFGTHMVLFALTHVVLFRMRERLARHELVSQVTLTLFANLALFVVFSFTQMIRTPIVSAAWPRLLMDLVCSQVFVALVTPWFFALQSRMLELFARKHQHFT